MASQVRLLALLLLLEPLSGAPGVTPSTLRLTFYDSKDFSGSTREVSADRDRCVSFNSSIWSVNTRGSCVSLYRECKGERLDLHPEAGPFFADVSRVVKRRGVQGHLSSPAQSFKIDADCSPAGKSHSEITVYDETHFAGESKVFTLDSDACVDLQDMRDRVSSLKTQRTCAQLFLLSECRGDSIKVFPGSSLPATDFSDLLFPSSSKKVSDNTQSVRRCSVAKDDVTWPAAANSWIQLFEEPGFQGREAGLDLSDSVKCHPLNGFKVASVIANGNCVWFFADEGCESSDSRKVFPGSESSSSHLESARLVLSGRSLAAAARSVRRCSLLP